MTRTVTTSRINSASSAGSPEVLFAEAATDDPRRSDFEEIHKAAVTALDLLARVFPGHGDMPL